MVAENNLQKRDPEQKPKEITISIQSIIDEAVKVDSNAVETAYKEGKKNTVGLLSGKEWLKRSELGRLDYIRGLADLQSFLFYVRFGARGMVQKYWSSPLQWESGSNPRSIGWEALDEVNGRVGEVLGDKSFGDIKDAITQFYQGKPLLRDKSVLWVITVPLYQEAVKNGEPTRNIEGQLEPPKPVEEISFKKP